MQNFNRVVVIFVLSLLIFFFAYSFTQKQHRPEDVNNWKIGTSVSELQNYEVEDFVKLKQAGFDCIEMGLRGLNVTENPEETYETCKSIYEKASTAGIEIWSIHIPYGRSWDISEPDETKRADIIDKHRELFTICKYLKPEKLVIHGSFEPVPDDERAARFEASKESLGILANEAGKYDAQLTVECLPRTCIGHDSKEILALLEGNYDVEVCCDVNHLLFEKTEDFIETVGSHITTLHISDYDGEDERHWLPGQGIMNWNAVIGNLVSAGYQGPFMFECSGTPEEKMECWKKLKSDFLRSVEK